MTRLPAHNLWIFRGLDCDKPARHRGQPLDAISWYVGHAPAGDVASGPHPSAEHARRDAEAMTDTSGT